MASSGMNVVVYGMGYVGCVTAACLAQLGHRVTGIDKDQLKIDNVQKGQPPFFEPGLEEIVRDKVADGLLSASVSGTEVLRDADVVLICVGTPSARNGNLDLSQLRHVAAEISEGLDGRTKPLVVAVRSTVFPGTCEDVVIPVFAGKPNIQVVSNPEFLREGSAVKDFVVPSLVVVGGDNRAAVEKVASLYASLNVEPCLVSLRTAEMIKYACNAFHAVKISFANEVGALASLLKVSADEVMTTLCQDTRLNISTAYLKPGFAFGGSCLPKDLRALNYRANRLDLELPMLGSVLESNDEHLARAIQSVLDLPVERVGVIGLAFKENTDDLRESPVVNLLEQMIGKGRTVRVWDPYIRLDSIYGSNRNFILNAIPHIGQIIDSSLDNILGWSQYLVITQKPSAEVAERINHAAKPVLDLVGAGLSKAATLTA
jgi:GDP-mannose 6-dehydrogenase